MSSVGSSPSRAPPAPMADAPCLRCRTLSQNRSTGLEVVSLFVDVTAAGWIPPRAIELATVAWKVPSPLSVIETAGLPKAVMWRGAAAEDSGPPGEAPPVAAGGATGRGGGGRVGEPAAP